jgi:cholesterol oxidase
MMNTITSFPPLFGTRRALVLPPIEIVDITASDGTALRLHHIPGDKRGPVILAPGTSMTGLSFCIDTVKCNLAEYLHREGFDVWLFDWRTSPLLEARLQPYTLDMIAEFDWPEAVAAVRARTNDAPVGLLAHCLSAPALVLSLLRGHIEKAHVSSVILSQVAFDFELPLVGRLKAEMHVDRLFSEQQMIHFKYGEITTSRADLAITGLASVVPKSYECHSVSCARHSAVFGDLLHHDRVNAETHSLMGDLIPDVGTGFLVDVAGKSRASSVLTSDDQHHFDRLALPMCLISGEKNRTFRPESTDQSYDRLVQENGASHYRRHVIPDYGHLDCLIGDEASEHVYPLIAKAFDPSLEK